MTLDKKTLTRIAKIEKNAYTGEDDHLSPNIPDWEKIISDFTIKDDAETAREIYKIALKKADKFLESGDGWVDDFTSISRSVSEKTLNVLVKGDYVDRPGLNDLAWANQILQDSIPKFKNSFDGLLEISRMFFEIGDKKSSIKLLEKIIDGIIKGNLGSDNLSLSDSLLQCADFIGKGETSHLQNPVWVIKVVEEAVKLSDSSGDYYSIANHVLEDELYSNSEPANVFIYDNITLDWFKNIILQFIEKTKEELNESEGDWSDLANCARYIGAKNGFNDESWSNEIYKMSFNRAKFQSESENSLFPLRDFGIHIAKHTKLRGWAKEIIQLAIDIIEKDPYYKDDIDKYIYQLIDDIDKDWASELRQASNKGDVGPPDKIKLNGLFYDYAELLLSLDELKEELKNAIKHNVSLSEFILDGYSGCEYGVERSFDDTFFCTASSGQLILEDSEENIITTFQVEDIKTLTVEDSPLNNLDTFKITIEDGYRGDWRKYSLGDSISKNSSFDQSLLTFSISDDDDGSIMKIIYDGTEIEDYEDVTDARGQSTMLDLEYIDKNGNSKSFDPDMDTKELAELIK